MSGKDFTIVILVIFVLGMLYGGQVINGKLAALLMFATFFATTGTRPEEE